MTKVISKVITLDGLHGDDLHKQNLPTRFSSADLEREGDGVSSSSGTFIPKNLKSSCMCKKPLIKYSL